MHDCTHPIDPALLERVQKPFCIRLDWPTRKRPIAYTMIREDVAHCLMHEEMLDVPREVFRADIADMLRKRRPNHGQIVQALFYLCIQEPVYQKAGGVPTVDFAWVSPVGRVPPGAVVWMPWTDVSDEWNIRFGRQEPGPENVRFIADVSWEN